MAEPLFAKETELCAAFISALPKGWKAYPETGDFDILLVRDEDGFQIGVEAKLKLNAKVIAQACEGNQWWDAADHGPDCRAVLISGGVGTELKTVCERLGVTVIEVRNNAHYYGFEGRWSFQPRLPDANGVQDSVGSEWFETCPAKRIELPDFIPDVIAGDSAPVKLTPWKVKAIRIAVIIEKRGFVTRADFNKLQVNMQRWTGRGGWLEKDGNGGWIATPGLPDFKSQHPTDYAQIDADYERWKPKELAA